MDAVLSELRRSGVRDIALANLPEDSQTARVLPEISRAHGYHVGSRLGYVCARVFLGTEEERIQLRDKIRKRKSYRYNMNALRRQAPVSLNHLLTWDEVEPALPEFFVAHVARFLATNRISNVAHLERRVFLTELAKLLCAAGWLALTRLSIGKKAIAWNYGFRFKGSWFYYQPTFESSLEQYSPGICLLSAIIAEASETPPLQMVDLGLGAEGYKERFADGTRKTLHVTLSQSNVQRMKELMRYHVAEAVKRSPRLESSVRGIVAELAGARQRVREVSSRSANDNIATPSAGGKVALYELAISSLTSRRQKTDSIVRLDLESLAKAVMRYESDAVAKKYFLQVAPHLSEAGMEGLAVLDSQGIAVEFCWVSPMDKSVLNEIGFSDRANEVSLISEIFIVGRERSTPDSGTVIAAAFERIVEQGRHPWAAVVAGDEGMQRVLEQFGFLLRGRVGGRTFSKKSQSGGMRDLPSGLNRSVAKTQLLKK